MSIVHQCADYFSSIASRFLLSVQTICLQLPAFSILNGSELTIRIVYHALRAKNETQCSGMTRPKGKSRGGPDSLPARQISDLFKLAPEYLGAHKENEWDCGGRRNAQGCFRGSWNTRSSFSFSLPPFSPHLSLSVYLSVPPFGLSLLLPALTLSRSVPPFRLSPNALFTPSRLFANRNSSLQGGQRYYHEFT